MRRIRGALGWGCGLLLIVLQAAPNGHTPIASRWNFNEHLFPIFRDRCGSCHIEGGMGPMSLVQYQAAYPWAQAIREEVLGLRMPPWQAEDGFGAFRNGGVLTAREMDMILEWSSGGYPEGPRNRRPASPVLRDDWPLGPPALTVEMLEPFTLAADTNEVVRYFVIAPGIVSDRIVTGVDFRPGAPAIVRGAAVFVDANGTAGTLDAADPLPGFSEEDGTGFPSQPPVAVWMPGEIPILNDGIGYSLPAGADLVLRIHYRKTWLTEGTEITDRSRIGLHFAAGPASLLDSMIMASPPAAAGHEISYSHPVDDGIRIAALLPEVDIAARDLRVEGVTPDGDRIPLLLLREPDNDWPIRFWFDTPVELPPGSQIAVTARLDPAAERLSRATLIGNAEAPIRLAVDRVYSRPGSDR